MKESQVDFHLSYNSDCQRKASWISGKKDAEAMPGLKDKVFYKDLPWCPLDIQQRVDYTIPVLRLI
jgi:hypothetical protein